MKLYLRVAAVCQQGFVHAEEVGTAENLLLTKPDEPIEKRQRRIKQLMEDMPATLKAAEEAELAAAAAAKASQMELPSPEKVLTLTHVRSAGTSARCAQSNSCL